MVRADRLGVVDYLIKTSKKGASIKIICPITEENSEVIKQISNLIFILVLVIILE
jgi:hypothetical protein